MEGYWNEYVRGKELEEEAAAEAAESKAAHASGVAGNEEGGAQQPDTQAEESRGAGFEGLHADTTNGNAFAEPERRPEEDEGAGSNPLDQAAGGEGKRTEPEIWGPHLAAGVGASGLAGPRICRSESSSARGGHLPVEPGAPGLSGDVSDLRLQLDSTSVATSSARHAK